MKDKQHQLRQLRPMDYVRLVLSFHDLMHVLYQPVSDHLQCC